MFESAISKVQREIRGVEEEIKSLESIAAAEVAEEAWKKSWSAWVLSPIYKKTQDSEEEKADKERKKQERRIEKDMKERRIHLKKAELEKQENLLRNGQAEFNSADGADDNKIRSLQAKIDREARAREAREREAREKREREAAAERRRQEEQEAAKRRKREQEEWEKRQREAAEEREKRQREAAEEWEKWQRKVAEEAKKRQAANEAAARRRQEEQEQGGTSWKDFYDEDGGFSAASACVHDGWWPKVQVRTKCPKCHDTWNYLLECPGCKTKACPKCQSAIRPRRRNNNRW